MIFLIMINYGNFDNHILQMMLHHCQCLFGIAVGLYLDGFLGSLSSVTLIMEASTIFVNLRFVLFEHDMREGVLYIINGVFMAISFFVFRICWFNYALFSVCMDLMVYNWDTFTRELYPTQVKKVLAIIAIIVYVLFYGLNLYWFSRIILGFAKILGLTSETIQEETKKD